MSQDFFPKRSDTSPTIYAYKILDAQNREGLLKVGYTTRRAQQRVKEQLQTSGLNYGEGVKSLFLT
ncbi:GIY-YIG nuclease family protein [bacterium]|nr:GIY-YIG nuclease family protein [bacterium]